ncbi:MAG: cupin domain-containing protein [Cyclobacteriaceae bacterium]
MTYIATFDLQHIQKCTYVCGTVQLIKLFYLSLLTICTTRTSLTMVKKINWESVPQEEVNPSMKRRIITGEKMMIARMNFKDGFVVPLHHHVHEQITQVVSGKMRFWFGANKEQQMDLESGDVVVIPSNVPHEALMIGEVVEIDSWSPPREDWLDGTDDYLRK